MDEEDRLEPCKEEDYPALVSLLNRAFGMISWYNTTRLYTGTRTSDTRLLEEMASYPNGLFLQWMRKGQRLGCVFLTPTKERQNIWYLGSLSVDPEVQGSGMGQKLLKMSEEYLRQKGAIAVQIHVVQVRVHLLEWYRRRGYKETGDIEPFPYGMEGIEPLRDDTHFVVMQKDLERATD
jgi:predicted N-acetyltransferase YhbS